jgi:adenylate cyclase class 2
MNIDDQEIEVKFFVRDLATIEHLLKGLGAVCTAERVLETNLRFDTADGKLAQQRKALRLRQDADARLTFKGPPEADTEVNVRQEIEFQVSDFAAARRFLEALGYHVSVIYEKYRTTYTLNDLTIVLDEMPFGSFIEIEGPDSESIRKAAGSLFLDWQARSISSYLALFQTLRSNRSSWRELTAEHLTFDELAGLEITPKDLGLRYAD